MSFVQAPSFFVIFVESKPLCGSEMSGDHAPDLADFRKMSIQYGSISKVLSDPRHMRFKT
jgi:hypothetical protein